MTDYAKKDQPAAAKNEDDSKATKTADKDKARKRARRRQGRDRRPKRLADVEQSIGRLEHAAHDQPGRSQRPGCADSASRLPAGVCRSQRRQIGRELVAQVGPAQRESSTDRLQESQLVARVVADAVHLAGVDRPRLQQLAQAVGELDLARPVALEWRPAREDVGRQDVAADDRPGWTAPRRASGFSTRSRT